MTMIGRGNFLANLMQQADRAGRTPEEEFFGGTIPAAIEEWKEIAADTMSGVKEDVDKIAAWVSPTIDATPGRETWEDKIDRFIFDPTSATAPIEAAAMGAPKAVAAGARGMHTAYKTSRLGNRIDTIAKAPLKIARTRIEQGMERSIERMGLKAIREYGENFAKVVKDNEGLRRQLMDEYPDIVEKTDNWDDFGAHLMIEDPQVASQLFQTTRGRIAEKGADIVRIAKREWEEFYPKAVKEGDVPVKPLHTDVLEAGPASYAGAVAKARKKQRDYEEGRGFNPWARPE
jgi:hypothetical protein